MPFTEGTWGWLNPLLRHQLDAPLIENQRSSVWNNITMNNGSKPIYIYIYISSTQNSTEDTVKIDEEKNLLDEVQKFLSNRKHTVTSEEEDAMQQWATWVYYWCWKVGIWSLKKIKDITEKAARLHCFPLPKDLFAPLFFCNRQAF